MFSPRMKKYLVAVFIACTWQVPAAGQSIDSLQQVLSIMPDDTHKVLTYRLLTREYYAADQMDKMLEVANVGLALSRKLRYENGIDLFIYYKASALDIMGRGGEAIPLFEEGLQMAEKRGDIKVAADYHINLGTAIQGLGELDKALQHFLSAYEIYRKSNDLESLSKLLNNIGIIYRSQKKYDRAEEIYLQSLAIKKTLKDSLGMAASHQNLALLYSYGTDDRKTEAVSHLKTALDFYRQLKRYDDVAGCLTNLGQVYFNFKQYADAREVLNEAQQYFSKNPSVEYGAATNHLLGLLEAQESRHATAESYFRKGLAIARQAGKREQILPLLNDLAVSQNALGKNAEAYLNLKEATAIKDSITEEKRLALLEEMQTRFDVAQKDNLLKINQLELDQRTRQRNGFVTVTAILAILALTIFFGLRNRIQLNKKLAAQQAEIQAQTIRQLEQENKLTALTAMIEGQEKERSRIANDLHDGLGGLLASVKSHFNALPQPENSPEIFSKTNRLIDDACGEVRRISHNMMPRALALSGLNGALEDLAHDLEKNGIQCDLETEDIPLSPTQTVTTYRIIQELTNNVIKHAQATHLLIQLFAREKMVTIIIEDNGNGFDINEARRKKGLGLSSIESRVQFLHGTIEWDSVPGQGTTVVVGFRL